MRFWGDFKRNRSKFQKEDLAYSHLPQLNVGDHVRIRVAPDKLKLTHKGHLGFVKEKYGKTISWSLKTHEVIEKRTMRFSNKERFKVNKMWHDRYELLKIPFETNKFEKPKQIKGKVVKQKTLFAMMGKKSPKKKRKRKRKRP